MHARQHILRLRSSLLHSHIIVCLNVLNELMDICQKDGTSIVLVTHNLGVAAYMSDQIMVMQSGNVVEHGTAEEVIEHAQEDYTKKLLRAVPQIGGERYDAIGA